MAKEHYFISDMHMGGDGNLMECDYTEEFVGWLRELEQKATPESELIIMGDTFGLWESTQVKYVAAAKAIIATHQPIFDQLKRVGEKMQITMMVGNHDYDMACDPGYVPMLKEYNITLDTSLTLWREVGSRKLCIEHGQQADTFNAAPDWGNRYRPTGGILHHRNRGQRREQVFGARRHRLAEGYPLGRHHADPGLDLLQLLLP